MIIRLPIDTKSLYSNIKNDNKTGHTATVATPIKQGKSIHKELSRIREINENINPISREEVITKILSSSRAEAIITDVFVFDNLMVNGKSIDISSSFCMYIREETSPSNVHFGRQKLHYPPSFKYCDSEVEINNKEVMKKISELLLGYAFIIEAFEYDTETKILNFDAAIVGEHNVPYSKVFLNKRGVGNKFVSSFYEYADIYDSEIIALRENLGYKEVAPDNFVEVLQSNKKLALEIAIRQIKNASKIRVFSDEYPYSLYDIEYIINGEKYYYIVRFTATKVHYFNLPMNKIMFCNEFSENVNVLLISNINREPVVSLYSIEELNNMSKTINSITYNAIGE